MEKIIELQNEGNKPIWAMACRTPIGHTIYIHIGQERSDLHAGKAYRVEGGDIAQLSINDVEG